MKNDLLNRHGDYPLRSNAADSGRTGKVDIAENHASEYCAVLVSVAGQEDNANGRVS